MPTVQIVPLPAAEQSPIQPFAVIVEWTDDDDRTLPAQDIQDRYTKWAAECGAQSIMHVVESVSVYYPRSYGNAESIAPGPCPSAVMNPFADHPETFMHEVMCALLAEHPGRHTATVKNPDGKDVAIVWGDVELWQPEN